MSPQSTKWCSIAALLLTLLLWTSAVNYQLEVNLLISFAGAVVLIQALQATQYRLVASGDDRGTASRTPRGE